MIFDIPTLLVAVAVTAGCCAVARFLLCALHPGMPGLARWAWASVLTTIAIAFIAWGQSGAGKIWLSVAQLLIFIGLILSWDGFRRFLGRPGLSRTVVAIFGLVMLVPILLLHDKVSLSTRSAINAALIATISALIARDLFIGSMSQHTARRATGWLYALNGVYFVVRGLAALHYPDMVGHMQDAGFTAFTLFWWLCMSVGLTLGMALMTGERLQEDLDRQASRDPLTGSLNRRAFSQMAEKEVAFARRNNLPLSVLMMDLDHFKQINDRLGHASGDAILRHFVEVAGRVLRGEDVFCRFGGEEFMALLPGSAADQAVAAAERLRVAFAADVRATFAAAQALPFAVTVSIGAGQMRDDEDLDSAIARADAALYRAKAAGRDRTELAPVPPSESKVLAPSVS